MSTACGIFLSFLTLEEVHVYVPEWLEMSQCFQNLCWPEILCIPKVPQVDQRITATLTSTGTRVGQRLLQSHTDPFDIRLGLYNGFAVCPLGSSRRVKIDLFAWAVSVAGMTSFR